MPNGPRQSRGPDSSHAGTVWSEVLLVKRDVEGLRNEFGGVRNDIKELRDIVQRIASPRQPNYAVWISFIVALCAGLLFVSNLLIVNTTRPLEDRMARIEANAAQLMPAVTSIQNVLTTVQSQNAASITDRSDHSRGIQNNADRIGKLESQYAAEHADRVAREIEIETQFRAKDQSNNVQFAEQKRSDAEVRNALHELKAGFPAVPSVPYYFPATAKDGTTRP